ncbi:MAG: hypothetical protein ACRYGG_23275 [Janthinobacterium lividum]
MMNPVHKTDLTIMQEIDKVKTNPKQISNVSFKTRRIVHVESDKLVPGEANPETNLTLVSAAIAKVLG